jgi:hypothetical protein
MRDPCLALAKPPFGSKMLEEGGRQQAIGVFQLAP